MKDVEFRNELKRTMMKDRSIQYKTETKRTKEREGTIAWALGKKESKQQYSATHGIVDTSMASSQGSSRIDTAYEVLFTNSS